MKILVLNCGSSSVKFRLYEMENEESLASGNPHGTLAVAKGRAHSESERLWCNESR